MIISVMLLCCSTLRVINLQLQFLCLLNKKNIFHWYEIYLESIVEQLHIITLGTSIKMFLIVRFSPGARHFPINYVICWMYTIVGGFCEIFL
jgi:hypothetical protein